MRSVPPHFENYTQSRPEKGASALFTFVFKMETGRPSIKLAGCDSVTFKEAGLCGNFSFLQPLLWKYL